MCVERQSRKQHGQQGASEDLKKDINPAPIEPQTQRQETRAYIIPRLAAADPRLGGAFEKAEVKP